MTDIRLRGDERHRHPVAQLSPAQLRLQDEEEFVGRPETGGALHGADDDRAGVRRELLEGLARMRGMIDVADRLGMALGPETQDLVERQFGTGRDNQVIVVDRRAVAELDTVLGRMDAPCALRQQPHALRFMTSARSISISSRLRQPTATQGLDGTK